MSFGWLSFQDLFKGENTSSWLSFFRKRNACAQSGTTCGKYGLSVLITAGRMT